MNQAVDNSHMTGSSKLFLMTERKFWLDHILPSCVLMDGIAKAVYCLDYEPQDPNGKGLVLISYTWEDDSHKLLAVPDKKERLCLLRDAISRSFPAFAQHLFPACADYDQNVIQHDWLTDENAGGAFKLNRRGEDFYSEELFFQALDTANDTGFTWRVAVVPSQVDGWRVLFRPRVTPSVQLSTIVEAFWQRAILSNTLGRDITTALEISLWILLQVLQVL
ncbi:Flavin containing amine oxidoreductase [Agrobacterium tumefaciens]|nr:Flavin containing amine oxidoreductase [Agrobacterium tumefaciens]